MSKHRNLGMELFSVCCQLSWYTEGARTLPVFLEGVPGTGKTQIVHTFGVDAAKYLKSLGISDSFYTCVHSLPQTSPETIEGIPAPDLEGDRMKRLPLQGIRMLEQAKFGIWAGDEATSCSQATGAASMTLVQDGMAGDTVLPHTIARVLMYNPTDCAAAGREFSPPEINRGCVIKWELPNEDFLDYLSGGLGMAAHFRWLDPNWERDHIGQGRSVVKQYLKANPKDCNQLQHKLIDEDQASQSWASQRQWWNLSRLLAALFSLGEEVTSTLVLRAVEGTVGELIADKFIGFVRKMDMPDAEVIIKAALQKRKKDGSVDPEDTRDDRMARARKAIPDTVYSRPDKLRMCLESVADTIQIGREREDWTERWEAGWVVLEPVITGQFDGGSKKLDYVRDAARRLIVPTPPGANYPSVTKELHEMMKGMKRSKRVRSAS